MNGKFATPFHVKDKIIYDNNGQKVKLWGVNYYTPFNHNYFNLEELGKDPFRAVDEDLRQMKLLGVDLIRMHMYEREITRPDGHLVENRQMEVFDYLIDQCEKNGFYLMLTPMAYWNTVKNQIIQDDLYAFWNIQGQDAFGFSNFYSADSMIWSPEACDCQERYLRDLFAHQNKFSGKRLNELDNLVVWELMNEVKYPSELQTREEDPDISVYKFSGVYSRGELKKQFLKIWSDYKLAHPEENDEKKLFFAFRKELIGRWNKRFWDITNDYFSGKVLRGQFYYPHGYNPDNELFEILEESTDFDLEVYGTYLNFHGFEAINTDTENHLELARSWFARDNAIHGRSRRAHIAHEFGASACLNGYPEAAIGTMFSLNKVQIASFFTYTPRGVAAWNPGWLVHFMNLEHTPSKSAGFAVGGEIFRAVEPDTQVKMETEKWSGENFSIERKNDLVWFLNDTTFRYSADNDVELKHPETLTVVSGRGRSRFAECSGNGCYFLEKTSQTEWRLNILPGQRYLSEPTRGKAYRPMSNRYINCRQEAPISQLLEAKVKFRLNALKIQELSDASGHAFAPDADGFLLLEPGEYRIRTI